MKILKACFFAFVFFVLLFNTGCNNDDNTTEPTTMSGGDDDPNVGGEDPPPVDGNDPETAGTIQLFNPSAVADNFILVNDAGNNRAYIMDKEAKILHEWPLTNNLGNDAFLLPDGRLLASLETDDPKITLGGQGGKIQFVDADGTVLWNFDYSSEESETHHDVELLPNGNVLAMVWEKRTMQEAEAAGSTLGIDVFPDALIEVNPTTDEIVWEWHVWDHIIQEADDTKANFGVVADNPQLINVNYVPNERGDITHGNGISYDASKDLIYLSSNFFHEIWVIDHSTTTAEAAASSGGNFDKGGDLLYRFGNPEAYNNPEGTRLFFNNHYPNLLSGTDAGKVLVFVNGAGFDQSTVYELELPASFNLLPNTDNEPTISWSFTDPELFSDRVSGAVRLPNGNTMITEGDFGLWEVSRFGEVLWKFEGPGFYWRAYHYDKDAPEIKALGL